jgi:hypothetical protein
MRYLSPVVSLALAAAVFGALRPSGTEPPAKTDDPWVGTYLMFGEYDWRRTGQFGEAVTITITKEGDVYKLSKPFDLHPFKEVKKGVLQDGKGGLGSLFLGSMEFSNGARGRILRAEFCYESFYLVSGVDGDKLPFRQTVKETPPLKVAGAENLVRKFIFDQNPKMNPAAEFPLKDLTTKAMWERLDAQAFQVTEGVRAHETYVIKDKKVYHIGSGFGGHGVSSIAVADPNGDGRDKLIFAYSFGSGDHRSHVAVFDVLAKNPEEVIAPQAYFGRGGDLAVKNGEGQKIEIYAGDQKVGRLILEGKEGELKIAIRLNDDVPAEVKKGFKGVE